MLNNYGFKSQSLMTFIRFRRKDAENFNYDPVAAGRFLNTVREYSDAMLGPGNENQPHRVVGLLEVTEFSPDRSRCVSGMVCHRNSTFLALGYLPEKKLSGFGNELPTFLRTTSGLVRFENNIIPTIV
ncbi:MAG: hypothetical protein KJ725_10940 [Gammaproteobacteria bacterium]|jgi:hypothetical protein|nr:hypothetical protein [Gammaproteobacteria bacterium]